MQSSRSCTKEFNGISTEISVQHYADSTLILVTQVGKVGNLIQASLPATTPLVPSNPDPSEPNAPALPLPPIAIQLTPLLGAAPSDRIQTLHNLYASQIATIVWIAESENPLQVSRKNVIVGIALRKSSDNTTSDLSDSERSTFHNVMAAIQGLLRHSA